MVKKEYFDLYRFGKKDVELRAVKPQWKNSKIGDIATVHRGTLARTFLKVNYKRIFPEA